MVSFRLALRQNPSRKRRAVSLCFYETHRKGRGFFPAVSAACRHAGAYEKRWIPAILGRYIRYSYKFAPENMVCRLNYPGHLTNQNLVAYNGPLPMQRGFYSSARCCCRCMKTRSLCDRALTPGTTGRVHSSTPPQPLSMPRRLPPTSLRAKRGTPQPLSMPRRLPPNLQANLNAGGSFAALRMTTTQYQLTL